jgi:hypothetical protein
MRKFSILNIALLIFIYVASTITASTVTIYTDKVEWENALSGQFLTEDFSDDILNTGVGFVSTESGHINPAEENYQDVLASQSQNEPMTTWTFIPQMMAYGGNWILGGPGGSGNSLLVYLDGISYVGFISNSYGGEFWGFISETPFTSVKFVGGSSTNQQNYRLDDMVYSQIPEPSTLILLGFGGWSLLRKRTVCRPIHRIQFQSL